MKIREAEFENLKVTVEKSIATLTISKPSVLNALDSDILDELEAAIEFIKEDEEVSVVILTGEGKAFVAGADISLMRDMESADAKMWSERAGKIFSDLEKLEKPTIAAVNGFAMGGGCELALCCDIRIASESAIFSQPEVLLGIMPGFGGTVRLTKIVGPAKAKELIFTGERITAVDAERIGLVNRTVPDKELIKTAGEMALKIAANGQVAVRYSKQSINASLEGDTESSLLYESSLFGLCFATEDQLTGMNAFLDKKKPKFKNK